MQTACDKHGTDGWIYYDDPSVGDPYCYKCQVEEHMSNLAERILDCANDYPKMLSIAQSHAIRRVYNREMGLEKYYFKDNSVLVVSQTHFYTFVTTDEQSIRNYRKSLLKDQACASISSSEDEEIEELLRQF